MMNRKDRPMCQAAFVLREVFGNIRSVIVLFSDSQNDGTVTLLNSIYDLVLGSCALKVFLVTLDFFLINLQRTFFTVAHFRLLRENQSLKNACGLYAFHPKHLPLAQCIRQNDSAKIAERCSSKRILELRLPSETLLRITLVVGILRLNYSTILLKFHARIFFFAVGFSLNDPVL